MLTEQIKATFKDAARKLTGQKKRVTDYEDNYQARGRKKVETLLPNLAQDIDELVQGDVQADPKFQTPFGYLKVTAQGVRDQLIAEKGYVDEELPCRQTIGEVLNRLGYRLRPVVKAKPPKNFLRPT